MSRPTLPHASRKACIVAFRLTPSEFSLLKRKAREAGLRVNQLARITTLKNTNRIVIQTRGTYDPALLKRIERIGHNLNQLVKNAHIFGQVSPQVEGLCVLIEEIITKAATEELDE
jgi:hypothetical protein